jgi:hypothetical protein
MNNKNNNLLNKNKININQENPLIQSHNLPFKEI